MRHCYVLRVFTRGDVGGNLLGVVTDVTGLDGDKMQRIAYDLGFSETVFLDWRSGGVPHAHIFTPARELPFAGHPLVGAAWVLGVLGPGVTSSLSCDVGDIPFRVDGDVVWIDAPADQPVSPSSMPLAGVDVMEQMMVEMPLPYVVARLDTPEDVGQIAQSPSEGSVYLWAWEEKEKSVKARFFAAEHGVVEDPATGSAAVALAAVLRGSGMDEGKLEIHQGDEVGAPSSIRLEWSPGAVRVGGTVRHDEVRVLGT
jgi:trans-2,3-dihydro-3-hydroxyanthranilate isomerase